VPQAIRIECPNPNCRARYIAVLRDYAPGSHPLCVECDTPFAPRQHGRHVFYVFASTRLTRKATELIPTKVD